MRKFGLKLWSTNTDNYFEEAKRLYAEGVFSYIELYIVPNTTETIEKWKTLEIPFNIHCAHFMHGFNLAKREKKQNNRIIYEQVKQFADSLKVGYIIFHGGVDGNVDETVEQLKSFNEPRAVLENKPLKAIQNTMGGVYCRGAVFEEVKYILDEVGCGFCLDIGHAICSANSQKIDKWRFIEKLNRLKPQICHLSDNNANSEYDKHLRFGAGEFDFKSILQIVDAQNITIETQKTSKTNLDDFVKDIEYLNGLYNEIQNREE